MAKRKSQPFRFKKFIIVQDYAGMKVSTDACIQGASAAQFLLNQMHLSDNSSILDIGTGTGLLTLMIAQQLPFSSFTAIDINDDACIDALNNFIAFQKNYNDISIELYKNNIITASFNKKFNAIIINPPFFENNLKAENINRNDARHDDGLSKQDIAKVVKAYLANNGVLCILYPNTEWDKWHEVATSNGLYLQHKIEIYPTRNKNYNRVIGYYSLQNNLLTTNETFIIYNEDHSYTDQFVNLLQPYYLYL